MDPNAVHTPPPTVSPMPTAKPTTMAPTASNQPSMRPSAVPSALPTSSLYPTTSPAPTASPSSSPTVAPLEGVRIKLYWEEGYTWQDETIERKWCMINEYRGFPGTGKCWHGIRTEPCHQDMVYVSRCESDKRQRFNIIPMSGGTQYLLSVYREETARNLDEQQCFERSGYEIILKPCNAMNPLQRFWLPRGALFQKRFELSPITLANHCLTQVRLQRNYPRTANFIHLFNRSAMF